MTTTREVTAAGKDGPQQGRRERKWQQVHDRLYASAVELFLQYGFEATTMDAIGERADVARATVFNHFPQKAGFLEEWGVRRRSRVVEILGREHAADQSAAVRLRHYLGTLAEINEESRAETVVLMDAAARFAGLLQDPSLGSALAALVEDGQRDGEFRPEMDSGQAGTLLAAGYFTTVLRWIGTEPAPVVLADRLAAMLDLVLTGLRTDDFVH